MRDVVIVPLVHDVQIKSIDRCTLQNGANASHNNEPDAATGQRG